MDNKVNKDASSVENNNKIYTVMEKESQDRKEILEDVQNNMEDYFKNIVNLGVVSKNYDLLNIKYQNLMRESKEMIDKQESLIKEYMEEIDNLQNEIQILRRTIIAYKSKVTSLQSIISLTVRDFGIDQVSLASGISPEKIYEYLKDS